MSRKHDYTCYVASKKGSLYNGSSVFDNHYVFPVRVLTLKVIIALFFFGFWKDVFSYDSVYVLRVAEDYSITTTNGNTYYEFFDTN